MRSADNYAFGLIWDRRTYRRHTYKAACCSANNTSEYPFPAVDLSELKLKVRAARESQLNIFGNCQRLLRRRRRFFIQSKAVTPRASHPWALRTASRFLAREYCGRLLSDSYASDRPKLLYAFSARVYT